LADAANQAHMRHLDAARRLAGAQETQRAAALGVVDVESAEAAVFVIIVVEQRELPATAAISTMSLMSSVIALGDA